MTKEEKRQYNKEYYINHKEKCLESYRAWEEKHLEKRKEYRKEYYQKHKEKIIARARKTYNDNAEKRKNIKIMIDILMQESILTPEELKFRLRLEE